MLTKVGLSTVLHAEHRFSGRKPTPAISSQAEPIPFYFIQILLILSALFATSGEAGTTKPTRSTCSTNTVGRGSRNFSLYVVK